MRRTLRLYAEGEVEVTIRKPKRSGRANAYWWGAVLPAIQRGLAEAGQAVSCEALHVHFAEKYLPPRIEEVFGITQVMRGRTSELDSTSFFDFVEAVRFDEEVLALGVEVPEPERGLSSYKIAEPV
ncbi:MAG TPA: hypothetical protein VD838_10905 [Anaeromyxobacteraceae bacterium]|nr:hypothetical protein [Anaeromyxobacteraceae bacterium]